MKEMKKVLFVDEYSNITTLRNWLEGAGYSTECVIDPANALEVLKKDPQNFQAIIVKRIKSEIEFDGINLLKKIKKDPELKNIPVIVATSSEDAISYFEALEAGAYDCVYYHLLERSFWLYLIGTAVDSSRLAYAV